MSTSLPGLVIGHQYLRFSLLFPTRFMSGPVPNDPFEMFEPVLDTFQNPAVVFGGAALSFLVFILVWLLATAGEAALIRSVADYDDGRPRSLRQALAGGTRLLVRFIAIDTVIFLPLFIIVLALLLLVGGSLIGGILILARPGSALNDLALPSTLVVLLIFLLTLLSIPVLIISFMIRLVAFRGAALEDLPARPSLRRAWTLLRARAGQIIIVFILLYAVGYVVGMVTSLLITPFAVGGSLIFLGPLARGEPPHEGMVDGFLLAMNFIWLISLLPNMFYRIFSSAVWTLTYREWQRES
jgi:hypothetical protein